MRRILGFTFEDGVLSVCLLKIGKSARLEFDRICNIKAEDVADRKSVLSDFINYGEVVFLYPRKKVIEKKITLPSVIPSEVTKMAEWVVQEHVPYKKEEIIYSVDGIWAEDKSSDVLVSVINRKELTGYHDYFVKSGLYPSQIIPDTVPIFEFCKHKYKKLYEKENPAIIHMDLKETQVIFSKSGQIFFSRVIPIGEEDFARTFIEKAGRAKDIRKVLIMEIAGTFQHFCRNNKGFSVKTAILNSVFFGSGDLEEAVKDIMQISAIRLRDDWNTDSAGKNISIKFLGLAYLSKNRQGFVSREMKKEREKYFLKKGAVLSYILIGLFSVFMFLGVFFRHMHRDNYIARLDEEVLKVKKSLGNIQFSQGKLTFVKDYIFSKEPALEILRNMGAVIPGQIKITQIKYSKKDGVFVSGEAPDIPVVLEMAKNMEKEDFYYDVVTENIDKHRRKSDNNISFQIKSKVKF
jgi:hypothetical protein